MYVQHCNTNCRQFLFSNSMLNRPKTPVALMRHSKRLHCLCVPNTKYYYYHYNIYESSKFPTKPNIYNQLPANQNHKKRLAHTVPIVRSVRDKCFQTVYQVIVYLHQASQSQHHPICQLPWWDSCQISSLIKSLV